MPNISANGIFTAHLGRRFAFAAAIIGWLVVVGWFWGVTWLTQLNSDWASMKINTALGFIIAGSTLYARHHSGHITAIYHSSAILLMLLGLSTLLEYGLGVDLGIDQWLLPDSISKTTPYPGRMSLAGAICFVLLGATLLLDGKKSETSKLLSSWLPFGIALIAIFAILGYCYQVESLYRFTVFSSMALHTAFVFLALSFSALSLNHEHPVIRVLATPKAKGLLPVIMLLPLLGWLRLEGQQRWGLYDTNFGTALLVLFIIFLWSILVVRSATTINQQDAQIQNQNLLQESILTSMGEGVVVADTNMVFRVFNPAAKNMLGVGITDAPPSEWQAFFGVFHPETLREYRAEEYPIIRALQGTHIDDEVLFIRNAQRPHGIYINVSARPIRDESGDIVGAVAVLHDISEK